MLPMPTKNPFSASSGDDDRDEDRTDDDVLVVEQIIKKPDGDGLVSLESRMKKDLEKKRTERQEQTNKNMELIRKLEEKIVITKTDTNKDEVGIQIKNPIKTHF